MKHNLKQVIIPLIIPAILTLLSLIIVFPFKDGIIASGEQSLYINPTYYNYLSIWEEKINFGAYSGHQSNIVLFIYLWNIFKQFSFLVHPSVIYIFLSYLLSGLFFYLAIKNIVRPKNPLILLPAVLLYTFSIFRMTSPINERLHLLLVFLPLFMWFHFRLLTLQKWKYVFALVIISFLSSSTGGNPPLSTIPYVLIALQSIFHILFFHRDFNKRIFIFQHLCLFILLIMANLFWVWPTIVSLLTAFNDSTIRNSMFIAIGSGTFLDHFRFIGSWAWRAGNANQLYYPFSLTFDEPIIYLVSMIVPVCILFSYLLLNRIKNWEQKALFYFAATLFPVSLALLAGNKGPTGVLLDLIYKLFPFLLVYRDPFAKFTPLFVLATSVMLVLFSSFLYELKSKSVSKLSLVVLSLIVLGLAHPFFNGQLYPARMWAGGPTGFLVKIPTYWNDAKKGIEADLLDDKLAISPFTKYGSSHIWPFGVGNANDVSEFLINKPIIKAWTFDKNNSNTAINNIFSSRENGQRLLSRYLGLLNVRSLLQMNDYDWRFSVTKSPSESKFFLTSSGLAQAKSFGRLSKEELESDDLEPDKARRENLIKELDGNSALDLYNVEPEDFLPHLYIPKQMVFATGNVNDLVTLVGAANWTTPGAVFFDNDYPSNNVSELLTENVTKSVTSVCATITCATYILNQKPVIEYKKISATKYRVVFHGASSAFPIVFSENYHSDWSIYLTRHNVDVNKELVENYQEFGGNEMFQATKEEIKAFLDHGWLSSLGNGSRKPQFVSEFENNIERVHASGSFILDFISRNLNGTIQNDNLENGPFYESWFSRYAVNPPHLIANGFANSWLINPKEICSTNPGLCIQNKDGTSDLEIVIEFKAQKILTLNLIISSLVVFASALFVVITYLKKNR